MPRDDFVNDYYRLQIARHRHTPTVVVAGYAGDHLCQC
jgi:hypothetical protein